MLFRSFRSVIEFFEMGGTLKIADSDSANMVLAQLESIPTLLNHVAAAPSGLEGQRVADAEFILEGLCASDKIGRSEERGFVAAERRTAGQDLYRDYTMERNRNKKPLN